MCWAWIYELLVVQKRVQQFSLLSNSSRVSLWRCNKVSRLFHAFKKKNHHVCGFSQKWCNKAVPINQQCYILTKDESKKFNGFIVFDYEAFVENNEHKANLFIVEKICQNCVDSDKRCNEECEIKTFTTNLSFCRWLFDQKNCIGIAHNLKGYDGCFLLQYILENHT